MIVLGVDPGIKEMAWAEMDMSGRRPRFVCGGVTPSRFVGHVASCQVDGMQPFGLFSVEQPVAPHPGGKVKTPQAWVKIVRDLISTALVAGEALGVALEHCPHFLRGWYRSIRLGFGHRLSGHLPGRDSFLPVLGRSAQGFCTG